MDAKSSVAEGAGSAAALGPQARHASRDMYAGDSILNSPGAHIGPEGLDEEATVRLLEKLLSSRATADYARSFKDYHLALRQFGGPTYQTLALRFPDRVFELEEIYVPLRTTTLGAASESLLFSEAMRFAFRSGPKTLLIEGAPGSGKSTLVRQIARYAWDRPEQIGLDRRYIALPLRLRSLALSKGAGFEDRIWSAIDYSQDLAMTGSRPPAGFYEKWEEQLNTPWLLLLDGFDEVPEEHRAEIINFIRMQIEKKTPLLITSRPTLDLPDAMRNSMRAFAIEPFSPEQQHRLAEIWLGPSAGYFEAAFQKIATGEVGRTPLLLTIAAIIYAKSHELPKRRSELYRIFVDDTWQEAWRRGKTEELGAELSEIAPAIIPQCLKRIALAMTEERGEGSALDFGADATAQTAMIKEILISELKLSENVAAFRAARILKFIGTASGVFKATEFQCEWLHPTFREFLAAEEIVDSADNNKLRRALDRFNEPTWRQVGLFILSILSERGSITAPIRELRKKDFPYGLAFAATAVAEEANIDEDLKLEMLNDLCDDIRSHAVQGFCERLLTSGNTGDETRKALSLYTSQDLPHGLLDKLGVDLGQLACAYGRAGSSAMEDLKQLGLATAIDRLAEDQNIPIGVRLEAARNQYLSDMELGFRNILEIVKQAVSSNWQPVAGILAGTNDDALLIRIAKSEALNAVQWGILLDHIRAETAPTILEKLAASTEIPSDFRLAAQVRSANSSDQIAAVLPLLGEKPELADPCIKVFIRNKDHSRILELATAGTLPIRISRLAVAALAAVGARSELQTVVANPDLRFALRRRAAEALYNLAPMDRETAIFLIARFFDELGKLSNTPRILQRRAFLYYFLGHYQDAIDFLDRVETRKAPTGFSFEVRGHCMESLGRGEEALAAYSSALQLQPRGSYARCRRSLIYWSRNERDRALADIAELSPYTAPPWYLWQAGDMLREVGRLDAAEAWLNRALEVDPDNADAINARLAQVDFDRGYFGFAIRHFEAALETNPTYDFAKTKLAKVLRIAGSFEQSATRYGDMIAIDSADAASLAARSEVFMRLGDLSHAMEDLQAAIKVGSDVWYDYLQALYAAFSGDRTDFENRIRRLVNSDAFGDDSFVHHGANRILLSVALGDIEKAQRELDSLVGKGEIDYLRYNTFAELDDLAFVLDATAVTNFRDQVKKQLWPEGCGLQFEPDKRRTALKRIRRPARLSPLYCQLAGINGMEQDRELADSILMRAGDASKTITIWRAGEGSMLYGQCNFKKDIDADYNLKFCDALKTVLENLKPLVQFGARRILFLEPDLLGKFQTVTVAKKLPIQCSLVDPSWIPDPRPSV